MKIWRGVPISFYQASLVEGIEIITWFMQFIVLVISAVFFIRWLQRSYFNLSQFETLQFSTTTALISWFIPFLCFVIPIMVYSAIVKGFERVLVSQNYIRINPRRYALKNWWWITWIAGILLLALSFGYNRYNFFCAAMSAAVLMLSNLLLISSLNDMKMMEEGIGELKDVTLSAPASEDLLDDMM